MIDLTGFKYKTHDFSYESGGMFVRYYKCKKCNIELVSYLGVKREDFYEFDEPMGAVYNDISISCDDYIIKNIIE